MPSLLVEKALKGLSWGLVERFGTQFLRILFSIVLARLLAPEDFGLISLAMILYNFLQIIAKFGIGDGIIQARNLKPPNIVLLFRINLLLSIICSGVVFYFAPVFSAFLGNSSLEIIIKIMSLNFLFSALVNIPRAMLEKQLQFKKVAIFALIAATISGMVAIISAFWGAGFYSLVLYNLSGIVILAVLYLPWLPRGVSAPISAVKTTLNYSWKLSLAGCVGFIGKNIDVYLIGRWLGAYNTGLYSMSYRFTRLPVQNFAGIIDRVLFPVFSSINDDVIRIRRGYLKVLRGMSRIIFPSMTILFFLLPAVIPYLLGSKWINAILVMQIFCVLSITLSLGRCIHSVLQSLGRSDIVLAWVFVSTPINILAVWVAVPYGIQYVATSILLSRLTIHLFQQYIVCRILNLNFTDLLKAELAGLLPALPLIISGLAIGQLAFSIEINALIYSAFSAFFLGLFFKVMGPRTMEWLKGNSWLRS